MSGFDQYLCQCKPRVKEALARRLGQLSAEEVAFVLRHHDWQIEQFLSLVITASMAGAMTYLHNYGGHAAVAAGMAQTIDIRKAVVARFSDGKPYTYVDVAGWIADTHKVALDGSLKNRVQGIVKQLIALEELFCVSTHDSHNRLLMYASRRMANVNRQPKTRYRQWALEVKNALQDGRAMTVPELANRLCDEVDPLQRKAITDALNSLYRQGLVEFRGSKGAGRQYALVTQEVAQCCG